MPKTTNLPLQGRRIVEFLRRAMGPACGIVLADLGAGREAAC
jgi:crotonobetainyl-CoA:carnitine CoA-transferase CaiB-like acyl-CoA transferase